MTDTLMPPVVISNIGNIEVAHEFWKIAEWGFYEQMKMVGHQDIAMQFDGVDVHGLIQHVLRQSYVEANDGLRRSFQNITPKTGM